MTSTESLHAQPYHTDHLPKKTTKPAVHYPAMPEHADLEAKERINGYLPKEIRRVANRILAAGYSANRAYYGKMSEEWKFADPL